MSTRLFLVRHAHADYRPDEMRPLSAKGRLDALRVADILEPEGPEAIYSSPYRRARQTVEPLARRLGLEIRQEPNLRERSMGESRQQDWETAVRRTWDDFTFAHPGGETNEQALRRAAAVRRAVDRHHRGERVVLATHGNLLVLLLHGLDPTLGFELWRSLTFPDIYRLDMGSQRLLDLRRIWRQPQAEPEPES